jgi:hypothetical protein
MATDKVDALVIFGATGDLAKLETFRPSSGSWNAACSTCPWSG